MFECPSSRGADAVTTVAAHAYRSSMLNDSFTNNDIAHGMNDLFFAALITKNNQSVSPSIFAIASFASSIVLLLSPSKWMPHRPPAQQAKMLPIKCQRKQRLLYNNDHSSPYVPSRSPPLHASNSSSPPPPPPSSRQTSKSPPSYHPPPAAQSLAPAPRATYRSQHA